MLNFHFFGEHLCAAPFKTLIYPIRVPVFEFAPKNILKQAKKNEGSFLVSSSFLFVVTTKEGGKVSAHLKMTTKQEDFFSVTLKYNT